VRLRCTTTRIVRSGCILPPPALTAPPVYSFQLYVPPPASENWLALVETTIPTVRPGPR
jgi:hypothetical protein